MWTTPYINKVFRTVVKALYYWKVFTNFQNQKWSDSRNRRIRQKSTYFGKLSYFYTYKSGASSNITPSYSFTLAMCLRVLQARGLWLEQMHRRNSLMIPKRCEQFGVMKMRADLFISCTPVLTNTSTFSVPTN